MFFKMKKEFAVINKFIENIEGWLSPKEGELLYNLAKNCTGKGVIVEIGSWKGKSTICLAKGSKSGNKVKVYAIDPHIGSSEHRKKYGKVWTFDEFKKNIKKANVEDIVVPCVKTSEEAAKNFDKPVELIFIDGAHEYEFVKKDFELWFPNLIEGGVMAFHDTIGGHEGPGRVVREFLYNSKHFKDVKFLDSITYGKKVNQNSVFGRIKNRYVLFLKDTYELARKFHLPAPIKFFGKKIVTLLQKFF